MSPTSPLKRICIRSLTLLRCEGAEEPESARATAAQRLCAFAFVAFVFDVIFWGLLYLRPGPFGRPFALDPNHYVFHAMWYGAWAHAIVVAPLLLLTWLWPSARRVSYVLELSVATLLLCFSVVDHECQRFMGMHPTLSWVSTYGAVDRTPDVVVDALAADRGGAWSGPLCLLVALSYPWFAVSFSRRVSMPHVTRPMAGALAFGLLVLPTVLWNFIPGGTLRQAKVRPALLLALRELTKEGAQPIGGAELRAAIQTYQAHHRERDPRGLFVFNEPEFPLRKHYVGPPKRPERKPNFIVIQLETFRAKDMKSTNPGLATEAVTPFLDRLASRSDSALFTRYYASGVPTVYAFMSIHASLLSHPHKSIPAEATNTRIEGFPQLLREAGYHTMHFTGSDPDWDSQRVWLDRWYDEVYFDPAHHERDRDVFRAASARIRERAREPGPFLAYLVSISNHAPFRLPEKQLSLGKHEDTFDALHDTMHYTDDVVRELYESLENEPWFDDTIWIITGDHGYDLGDRGESAGHSNLRHETTWVPLIIHGRDVRLPRGRIQRVGSHIDLAPTIAELAYVNADNSFMGVSLLAPGAGEAIVLRGGNYSYEATDFSLYHAAEGETFVYAGNDLTQAHPLNAQCPELLERAAKLSRTYETVLVDTVDRNRVVPPADESGRVSLRSAEAGSQVAARRHGLRSRPL